MQHFSCNISHATFLAEYFSLARSHYFLTKYYYLHGTSTRLGERENHLVFMSVCYPIPPRLPFSCGARCLSGRMPKCEDPRLGPGVIPNRLFRHNIHIPCVQFDLPFASNWFPLHVPLELERKVIGTIAKTSSNCNIPLLIAMPSDRALFRVIVINGSAPRHAMSKR